MPAGLFLFCAASLPRPDAQLQPSFCKIRVKLHVEWEQGAAGAWEQHQLLIANNQPSLSRLATGGIHCHRTYRDAWLKHKNQHLSPTSPQFHDGHQFAGELPGLLQYNEKITCGHRVHLTAAHRSYTGTVNTLGYPARFYLLS